MTDKSGRPGRKPILDEPLKQFSISLAESQHQALRIIAASRGQSLSSVVRDATSFYLRWLKGIPEEMHTLIVISEEVIRSCKSSPGNKHMLTELFVEVGELARALLESEDPQRAREECIKVAAAAIRIYEEGDVSFSDNRETS